MQPVYRFGECELDTERYELRVAGKPCHLEPQVFDVLRYLVENHGRLVTKQELFEQVWPEAYVGEAALNSRIMAARKAIGDSGRDQRLIKTVHGRGFRFIAPVEVGSADPGEHIEAAVAPAREPGPAFPAAPPVVGREAELALLRERFAEAEAGRRCVTLVTGDAGLGKSTLVWNFLDELRRDPANPWIGYGQCFDHHGVGETYMPVLEALGGIARGPRGDRLAAILATHAPTWLARLPWLLDDARKAELADRIAGATQDRMLREIAEALDTMAAEAPVVLVLDDLHWADAATADFVSYFARRPGPAGVLLVCSLRAAELEHGDHPVPDLRRDLRVRDLCAEISLSPLSATDVEVLVEERLPGAVLPPGAAQVLVEATGGNPLFLGIVCASWVEHGNVIRDGDAWVVDATLEELTGRLPETLRDVIEEQLARLEAGQRWLLEVAAVAGIEFEAPLVAAVADVAPAEADAALEALARQGRLIADDGLAEWPDGTLGARYRFVHSLYREVLYEGLLEIQKVRLHRSTGLQLEAVFGEESEQRAATLASHFVHGRDRARALRYLWLAAQASMRSGAHREAVTQLELALERLDAIADTGQRMVQEAAICAALGESWVARRGFGAPEAESAFNRALELARTTGDLVLGGQVTLELVALREYQGRYRESVELLNSIADYRDVHPAVDVAYNSLLSCWTFHQGSFSRSLDHAQHALDAYDPQNMPAPLAFMGEDPGICCREWQAQALWFLGYPDQALAWVEQTLAPNNHWSQGFRNPALRTVAARIHQLRGEPELALQHARATIAASEQYGYDYQRAVGHIVAGWAVACGGDSEAGIREIRDGLDLHAQTGALMDRPYYLGILASTLLFAGEFEECQDVIEEALQPISADHAFFFEAELYRLRGDACLAQGYDLAAEGHYRRARQIAGEQGARSIALRAATSLAECLAARGSVEEAREVLEPVFESFEEGFDTRDLVRAREVLQAVTASATA